MARKYTQQELNFIINNYKTMSNNDIGAELRLTRNAIRKKLKKLGLKKTQEEIRINFQNNKHKNGSPGILHPLYATHRPKKLKEKLSKLYIGKTWEELHGEQKAKQMKTNASINMSSEKNPSWIDVRSYEPYCPNFSKSFKFNIRARDGFLCIKCGMREEDSIKLFNCKLHNHHVNYNKKLTIKENCCALCIRCNSEVNTNRIHWIKFFQSMLSERYGYQYDTEGNIIQEINLKEAL